MVLPIPRRYRANRRSAPVSSILRKQQPLAYGSQTFAGTGTSTFIVPPGVYSVSIVAVGSGGAPASSTIGGAGGGLAYVNDIPVRPGQRLTVRRGAQASASGVYISQTNAFIPPAEQWIVAAMGGTGATPGYPVVGNGYRGGVPGDDGGAGAAGYKGDGGNSGATAVSGTPAVGSGGGGGGGNNAAIAGGGGGVGLLGLGSDGVGTIGATGGVGGSGGTSGMDGYTYTYQVACCTNPCVLVCVTGYAGGDGGAYGGGAANGNDANGLAGIPGVRIVWPGNVRLFPDKRVGSP